MMAGAVVGISRVAGPSGGSLSRSRVVCTVSITYIISYPGPIGI